MSSIAYVSDEKMLEFHRLNASSHINFWRLSIRKFERFAVGDLLFFIDKRYPHPVTKEKGIIGYGKANQFRTMSVKRMWDQFEQENGYSDYESFKNAILGYGNDDTLPKQIQSIYLTDVHYFRTPVYLSELDVSLSNRLESFTYLSYEQSSDIITLGKEQGLDPWTQMMNPQSIDIDLVMKEQRVRKALENIQFDWTQTQEKTIIQLNKGVVLGSMAYEFLDDGVSIYIPVSSIKKQLFEILGLITFLKHNLQGVHSDFVLVTKVNFEPHQEILTDLNLKLVCI